MFYDLDSRDNSDIGSIKIFFYYLLMAFACYLTAGS